MTMLEAVPSIHDILGAVFGRMDRNGYLPESTCSHCGATLGGEYSIHPAESYAGTWNGLCYRCTASPAFLLRAEPLSGVGLWSHPPHCPAWRRDRETFLFAPGCTKCDHGRIMVYRSYSSGGSYPRQCDDCSETHYRHPRVQAEEGYRQALRDLIPWSTHDLQFLIRPILEAERRHARSIRHE